MIQQIQQEERAVVEFYKQNGDIVADLTDIVKKSIHHDSSNIAATIYELTSKLGVFVKYDTQEKLDDFMLSEEALRL